MLVVWLKGVPGLDINSPDKELKAFNTLMSWLKGDAKAVLATTLKPVEDREAEFKVVFLDRIARGKHQLLTFDLRH